MSYEFSQLRTAVAALLTGGLAVGIYLVLDPFISPIAWAMVMVLSTWPLYRKMLTIWPDSPKRCSAIMTLSLALLLSALVAPVLITLASEVDHVTELVRERLKAEEPVIPETIKSLPVAGPLIQEKISEVWRSRSQVVSDVATDYQEPIVKIATGLARGLFSSLFTLVMALLIAFFLFQHGQLLANQVRVSGELVGGERFERLLDATRETVRGAVYGVILTAITQGILAGLGYLAVGAPTPILLGFLTMVMSLIPFGTPLVYLPVALLIVLNGAPVLYGVLLAVWGVAVVSTADNLIRPIFISASTNMPILLSFIGVVGGLVAFGLIGIIVGPVLLAVAMVLWRDWLQTCEVTNNTAIVTPTLERHDRSATV